MPKPKSCKSRKRKGSASKPPEVFVLSPQLLHKLGINIANIEIPTPASSSISVSAQDDLFKKPKSTRKSKSNEESSVMTTATLMKESVLLSPSFINPTEYQESIENIPVSSTNVDTPAIHHRGNGPECSNISQKIDHLMLNSDNSANASAITAKADPIFYILKENDGSGKLLSQQPSLIPSKMYTSYNLDQSCSNLQYHIQTCIAENQHFNLQKDLMCNKKKKIVQDEDKSLITLNDLNIDDDHLDEAYSSDCSNGNNTISAVSAEFNLEPPNVGNIKGQKINILSEEVIDNSRLNEMISKSLSPSLKEKMIPVSVDTIMSFNKNVTKADNSSEATKYKCESNSQDQLPSENVSIEQVSTADESFLDNIITGVMKIDEIDINILDVSDAELNTHYLSNSVNMNVPKSRESNKLDNSNKASGTVEKNHTKLNLDCTTDNLRLVNNVEIANVQDISKVMINKNHHQVESNRDILIEFIDKYPELTEDSLNTINRNEHDCAIISQIEADIKTIHDTLFRKPNPALEGSVNLYQQNEISTMEKADVIFPDNNIKDNIVIDKEQEHIQQIVVNADATESGVVVNDEVLDTPTDSKIEMHTDCICHCKCNIKNTKSTHIGDATNGKSEKLNEIASYLKMFVENKRRKSATMYSKSRPPNFSSEAVLKPKSCVHGVEKPGGSNEDGTKFEENFNLTREIKKEPRIYKRNKNAVKPSEPNSSICNTIITYDKDINISDCIIPERATDYFCLCNDYGTFNFYDIEGKSYSHIHYWDNMSIDSDVVEWFSEFNYIDYVEKNLNEESLISEITESHEKILDPICWIGWNYSGKTIAKDLLFGNVVKDFVHMTNVTNVDIPDNAKRNDTNDTHRMKMVSQDTESETNSINVATFQVEAADDPNNECEVIYQVIECLDDFESVQAGSYEVDVLNHFKENKNGDDKSVGKSSTTSTRQTKRKPSINIIKNSTQLEDKESNATFNKAKPSINTGNKVSKGKSCRDINTKTNVEEENTIETDKKESIEINPVLNVKKLQTYEKSHYSEQGLQKLKILKKYNRKRSSNFDKVLLDNKGEVIKKSKRQPSEDIKPEFTLETSTKLDKRTCTKEHDLKSDKSGNIKLSRKAVEPEVNAEELNSLMEVEKGTNTYDSIAKRPSRNAGKEAKLEENAEKFNSCNNKDKIAISDAVFDLRTNESTAKTKSQSARKDIMPEIDAKVMNSLNKSNKIPSPEAVCKLKPIESTTKRESRNARKDTKAPGGIAEELTSFGEKDKISNTDVVNKLKTKESNARRESRNARKDTNHEIDAEKSTSLNKTHKITSSETFSDLKTIETASKMQSCHANKNILPEETVRLNNFDENYKIANNDAEPALKTYVSITRRQSRNTRKDIKPEIGAEDLNKFMKRDSITIKEAVHDPKPNESTARRRSRNDRKDINSVVDVEKIDKFTKLENITDAARDLQPMDLQPKESSTKKQSSNARKDIKLDEDAKELNSLKKTVDKTNKDTNSSEITRRRSCRISSEKLHTSLIETKSPKTKRKRSATKSIDTDSSSAEVSLSKITKTYHNTKSQLDLTMEPLKSDIVVKVTFTTECGVCDAQVEGEWIDHIAEKHFYLAWKKGDLVLDLNNPNAVKSHLKSILTKTKKLTCSRCDSKLKNPKTFLKHIKSCDKSDDEDTALSMLRSKKSNKGEIVGDTKTCGMCSETVGVNDWDSHVMFTHYNLAWAVGDTPRNLRDPNLIYRLLKVYKSAGGKFECNMCGVTRSSAIGFFAHVIGCGKSAEEMEEYMEICDQCKKSYLCVNRQPHMAWHTQVQIKKETKIKAEALKLEASNEVEEIPEDCVRKRKAARKAISMIQKLKSNKDESLTCERCDYTGSTREKLKSHKCVDAGTFIDQGDESEDSLEFASDRSDDGESDETQSEGEQSDEPSLSGEEKDKGKRTKRKCEHASRYERIPFEISSEAAAPYVENASRLFIKHNLSDEILFEKWRNVEYTVLTEEEIAAYTPQVAESCKFATAHKWTSLKRFESVKQPAIVLFAGGCPASMCWVPGRINMKDSERNYLALMTHLGPDPPRYSSLKLYTSPGTVLQIWDFGDKPHASNPKLSMCIAMDKGTVWSMSWCPSGARDSASSQDASLLGLVAVACSDGTAYVYSVPHPAFLPDGINPAFVKLKPVAELRLYYDPEKEICQPSKVFWSMEKGHAVVAVGYSNGMIAFFDLCAESPLTRKCEGDRDIFYPFFSQQAHWSCITGISMYPRSVGAGAVGTVDAGLWAAGSAAGGALVGAGSARQLPAATTDTMFLPLWPSALMLSDDSCMSELEPSGVVRKFSAAAAATVCLHCSKLAQFSSPLLKSMMTHPIFKDVKKRPQALIQMCPLKLDPKHATPDLFKGNKNSVALEPFTYEEAIEQYGVRLKYCKKTDRLTYEKEFHPGRFPLSEVTAMAFCPTPSYHHWLAVATHSGLVFFINTS